MGTLHYVSATIWSFKHPRMIPDFTVVLFSLTIQQEGVLSIPLTSARTSLYHLFFISFALKACIWNHERWLMPASKMSTWWSQWTYSILFLWWMCKWISKSLSTLRITLDYFIGFLSFCISGKFWMHKLCIQNQNHKRAKGTCQVTSWSMSVSIKRNFQLSVALL